MILLTIIILLCYFVFFIWLTEGLRKSSYKNLSYIDEFPTVSIIISARNEEKNIPNLLISLSQLTFPIEKLEIIVVNDRSSDNTQNMLKMAEKELNYLTVINIKETPIDWAPKKWALQQAIEKSKNAILLQTDADCIFEPDWVQTMVNPFINPSIGFIAGPAPIRYKNPFFDQFAIMDSLSIDAVSASTLKHGIALSCVGRNISFRKSAFFEINGYEGIQDQISGDDDLLMQKMASSNKWLIDYICHEKAVINSPGPETIEEFLFQRLRFASKGLNYFSLNTNNVIKKILPFLYIANIFTLISISIYVSTLDGIWLLPLLIKACGDCLLTITFFNKLNKSWSLLAFSILEIIHPFYIVIFATIAPFHKIKWKN